MTGFSWARRCCWGERGLEGRSGERGTYGVAVDSRHGGGRVALVNS